MHRCAGGPVGEVGGLAESWGYFGPPDCRGTSLPPPGDSPPACHGDSTAARDPHTAPHRPHNTHTNPGGPKLPRPLPRHHPTPGAPRSPAPASPVLLAPQHPPPHRGPCPTGFQGLHHPYVSPPQGQTSPDMSIWQPPTLPGQHHPWDSAAASPSAQRITYCQRAQALLPFPHMDRRPTPSTRPVTPQPSCSAINCYTICQQDLPPPPCQQALWPRTAAAHNTHLAPPKPPPTRTSPSSVPTLPQPQQNQQANQPLCNTLSTTAPSLL